MEPADPELEEESEYQTWMQKQLSLEQDHTEKLEFSRKVKNLEWLKQSEEEIIKFVYEIIYKKINYKSKKKKENLIY